MNWLKTDYQKLTRTQTERRLLDLAFHCIHVPTQFLHVFLINVLDYNGTLFLTKRNIFNGTWSMLYKAVTQKCNQFISVYVKWIYSWSQVMVSKRKPKLGFCVLWLCFKPLKQLVYFRWRLCFLPPSLVKGNVRGDCLSPARQVIECSLKDLVRGGGSWANGGRLGLAQAHGPESRPTTKSKDKSRSCKMSSQTFKT